MCVWGGGGGSNKSLASDVAIELEVYSYLVCCYYVFQLHYPLPKSRVRGTRG